jgi:hypothetical protein
VKFPCKLCKYDHLTHLCPKIEEASRLLSQPPTVLTNPFPHNQHMASGTSNTGNASSGSQNPSTHEGGHLCVNMVKSQIDVATRSRDYGSSQTVLGPEPPPPPGNTLADRKVGTSASYSERSTKALCPQS